MSLTTRSPWSLDVRPLSSYALVGTGVLLAAATLLEVLARLVGEAGVTPRFLAGALVSLAFIGVLIAGGYRLHAGVLPAERFPLLAASVLIGTAVVSVTLGAVGLLAFETSAGRLATLRLAVTVGAGSGFLAGYGTARSIDRQIEAERQRVRAEEAERRRETLEYLNAILRHEVLNAAAAIDGHATLARDRLNGDTDLRSHIDTIQRRSDDLAGVIDDVKLLLRAEGDGAALEPVDLARVLRAELREVSERFPAAETTLECPGEVYVRADRFLRRLFASLLRNAVEHDDGPTPRVTVRVGVDAGTVTVRIEDDGPGVPPDRQQALLDPNSEVGDGDGLGLTIAGRLADRYGGRVELVRTGPDGSVFAVELPRAEPPESERESETRAAGAS